jgi:putative transposase
VIDLPFCFCKKAGKYARIIYELKQKFITPHCSEQNGVVEWEIRLPEEQSILRKSLETLQHANRMISN